MIGGGNLMLRGLISRTTTKDLDLLGARTADGVVPLRVWMAGRFDMICFKLYAAVDQGTRSHHFQDLRELRPTRDELVAAGRWTTTHDPSSAFRALLISLIEALGVENVDAALR